MGKKIKAYYLGGHRTEAFNTTFEPGKPSEVDEKFAGKIANNPYFSDKPGDKAPEQAPQPEPENPKLEARHKGAGSYSIFAGEREIVGSLTKDDADNFNAMSDDEKSNFVDAHEE